MKREDIPNDAGGSGVRGSGDEAENSLPAPRFRRSCVLCGVHVEDEEHECSLEDLMESAARNAEDQIGTYG